MGSVHFPPRVQLFCGLLVAPAIAVDDVEATLTQHLGTIVLRSAPQPFTQTTYYEREMGPGLTRLYVAFQSLIDIAALVAIKHLTNHLENQWCTAPGQRQVNIDPGYLDLAKVVLATTKDHAHRLYIGAGIFAEVTLRYWQKRFQPWEWTYPDYRLPETRRFFQRLRQHYSQQLRS